MTFEPRRVAIVGASAAGLSVATALRDEGYDGDIALIGAEDSLPYDRPPLSKRHFAGRDDLAAVALADPAEIDDLGIDCRLGSAAKGLDVEARSIFLENDAEISWDTCVIATGAAPIRLPGEGLVLRSFDDAVQISRALERARHVVIIGAGVLGCELAALARASEAEVLVVDLQDGPMLDRLGPLVSQRLESYHRERGVEFCFGMAVAEIAGSVASGFQVTFANDLRVETDLVLIAIGCRPATAWLAGSALPLEDGVVCDAYCAAAPGVYAAGDVANWINPRYGRRMRIEHRMNATEQGMAVAANILGAGEAFAPIPFFWTDQYDIKLHVHGVIDGTLETDFLAENSEKDGFVIAYSRDGRVEGVLGWNMARRVREARALIGRDREMATTEFMQNQGA